MAVLRDIVDGAELVETEEGGLVATRIAYVDGVTGDGAAKNYRALRTGGVPRLGEAHPAIPGLHCTTRRARPVAADTPTQYRITCTYTKGSGGVAGRPTKEVGAGLSQGTTHRDANGKLISYSYTAYATDEDGNVVDRKLITVYPGVAVQRPQIVCRVKTTLRYNPTKLAKQYVGHVGGWGGGGARDWLCTNISGTMNDDGETYATTFEFTLPPAGETWAATVEQIDAEGNPIPGRSPLKVDVFPWADFRKLPIGAPDA